MGIRVAILGWGSLLWDKRPEFDRWRDVWRYDGPTLKLEFSRISKTRNGALTLVIDPVNGMPVIVAHCRSKRSSAEDAICDLRCREGTVLTNIGYVRLATNDNRHRDAESYQAVVRWAEAKGLDAVVWTDLESNFEQRVRQPFSVDAACRYLQTLDARGKAKALGYIQKAPDFVQTPLRRAVQETFRNRMER